MFPLPQSGVCPRPSLTALQDAGARSSAPFGVVVGLLDECVAQSNERAFGPGRSEARLLARAIEGTRCLVVRERLEDRARARHAQRMVQNRMRPLTEIKRRGLSRATFAPNSYAPNADTSVLVPVPWLGPAFCRFRFACRRAKSARGLAHSKTLRRRRQFKVGRRPSPGPLSQGVLSRLAESPSRN